jgi:hypothetical protein
MKDLKWKHDKDCCNEKGLEVLTPYPKKRNNIEIFLDRYNHIMEFTRTILALITVTLQLIILYRLFN